MNAPLRILAPVDGHAAELSSLILPLAAGGPLEVTLFRAGKGGNLREASKIFRMRGLPAETVEMEGEPAAEIGLLAKAGRFDLVAMFSHGRRGLRRALLGSVAEEVVRRSTVPVLLAHPRTSTGPWGHVVAALDGSPAAERILPMAARLAKAAGTPLQLLRIHGPAEGPEARDYLARVCARLDRRGIAALPTARRGLSARGIVRYVEDVDADLLCLTTHGRTGLRRLLIGSVAEEVVRRAPCPVLVLRV